MKILQIGQVDLKSKLKLAAETKWEFWASDQIAEFLLPYTRKEKPRRFDYVCVIITAQLPLKDFALLKKFLQAYRVILLDEVELPEAIEYFCAKKVTLGELGQLIPAIERDFFPRQYGDNAMLDTLEVSRNFKGEISYQGKYTLTLAGDFGTEFTPLATYKRGFYIAAENGIELWPVFEKDPTIELKVVVHFSYLGGIDIDKTLEFSEEQLARPLILDSLADNANAFVSIWAKGQGTLKLGNINNRLTRHQYGTLIMGGQRFFDSKRQELFYYFDPGDLKPPLNVYFAGWQTRTGFEGYFMMKHLGRPFLLLADPRLEGGAFYLGSKEYEENILSLIQETLAKLGFTNEQLVLAGLSMGTTGALYYGSKLGAHAVIVGKPLINLGAIARNNTLHRANSFDTSLDLLLMRQGENSLKATTRFDHQMLAALKDSPLTVGQILAAYMREDDYDGTAFHDIIKKLQQKKTKVIGHGYTGRHNDASSSINGWFIKQYELLLQDFERKSNETD